MSTELEVSLWCNRYAMSARARAVIQCVSTSTRSDTEHTLTLCSSVVYLYGTSGAELCGPEHGVDNTQWDRIV